MTPPGQTPHAEAFRIAVESGDAARTDAAVHDYLAWFRSAPRSLAEVAQARDLFQWGVQAATARKAHLAQELTRLTTLLRYRPPGISHTWHVEG